MLSKPVIIALFLAAVAEARSVIRRETCVGKGQSCDIANLSGSTGVRPSALPKPNPDQIQEQTKAKLNRVHRSQSTIPTP
jgi:hypothetical protein